MRRSLRVVLAIVSLVLWIDGLLWWRGDEGPVGWLFSLCVPQAYLLLPAGAALWACRKKDRVAASVGAAAALGQLFGPMGLCCGTPSRDRMDLRVMSYNVECYSEGPERVADTIRRADPDVFCLQEASFQANLKPPTRFMAFLPGYHYFTEGGMVIASKTPFERAEVTTFPSHLFPTNWNVQEILLKVGKRDLRVINVHMVPDAYEPPQWPWLPWAQRVERKRRLREEEFDEVVRRIESKPGPLVVCGDFNQHAYGPRYRRLADRLTDAYRATSVGFGYTLTPAIPTKRVDYVWTRGVRPLRTRVASSRASDHLPVVAELAF